MIMNEDRIAALDELGFSWDQSKYVTKSFDEKIQDLKDYKVRYRQQPPTAAVSKCIEAASLITLQLLHLLLLLTSFDTGRTWALQCREEARQKACSILFRGKTRS